MLEIFLTHAIPPTRVRLLIRGAVSPRDRLSAPPAKESSTRARRPRRLVDLLTVALQRSEYYRRQAAGQLEGPDAPFPFEEEIAKQIHARSIAQARVA